MKPVSASLVTGVVLAALGAPASAQLVYSGAFPQASALAVDHADIENGLYPIIFVQPGVPTYAVNNLNGIADILTSPGGTYNTVNTNPAFNFAPSPFLAPISLGGGTQFPLTRIQPAAGAFGGAFTQVTGTRVNFSLRDNSPVGGGTVSSTLATWQSTFDTGPAGYAGPFTTFLGFRATLLPGSEVALALRTTTFANNGQILSFPQIVMAATGLGPGAPGGTIALGGIGGGNARVAYFPRPGGGWFVRGLAVNNIPALIPAGGRFTAYNTLTLHADPADMDAMSLADLMADPLLDSSFFDGLELPNPDGANMGSTVSPTPGALSLAVIAGAFAARRRRA